MEFSPVEIKSLAKYARTEYIEKKSVFYGTATPVSTEKEALDFISAVKKEFSDATHNVFAYSVNENGTMLGRFSDDGEPHGTAGLPVMDVIRKSGLENVAVVVTRYFGGILLGAGGLVRAYTASAKSAVDSAGIISLVPFTRFRLCVSYPDSKKISYLLTSNGVLINSTEYLDSVTFLCDVLSESFDEITKKTLEATNGKISPEKLTEILKTNTNQ